MNNVGRVLDSRWMMALSVLAVLVAIAWALLERTPHNSQTDAGLSTGQLATVELLGVPPGAEVLLDGRRIENTVFGVSPQTRHALEVRDDAGRSWRQVFVARGSLTLIVELRTYFVEVQVPPTERQPAKD